MLSTKEVRPGLVRWSGSRCRSAAEHWRTRHRVVPLACSAAVSCGACGLRLVCRRRLCPGAVSSSPPSMRPLSKALKAGRRPRRGRAAWHSFVTPSGTTSDFAKTISIRGGQRGLLVLAVAVRPFHPEDLAGDGEHPVLADARPEQLGGGPEPQVEKSMSRRATMASSSGRAPRLEGELALERCARRRPRTGAACRPRAVRRSAAKDVSPGPSWRASRRRGASGRPASSRRDSWRRRCHRSRGAAAGPGSRAPRCRGRGSW